MLFARLPREQAWEQRLLSLRLAAGRHVPGAVCITLVFTASLQGVGCSRFISEKSGHQRGYVAFPKPQGYWVVGPGFELHSSSQASVHSTRVPPPLQYLFLHLSPFVPCYSRVQWMLVTEHVEHSRKRSGQCNALSHLNNLTTRAHLLNYVNEKAQWKAEARRC